MGAGTPHVCPANLTGGASTCWDGAKPICENVNFIWPSELSIWSWASVKLKSLCVLEWFSWLGKRCYPVSAVVWRGLVEGLKMRANPRNHTFTGNGVGHPIRSQFEGKIRPQWISSWLNESILDNKRQLLQLIEGDKAEVCMTILFGWMQCVTWKLQY